MKRFLYSLVYTILPAEWIFGSRSKIENFVDKAVDGRINPGKAITLGCGVGRETIHLARKGFDVTGLDFSPIAIRRARKKAQAAGLDIPFIVDDLTNLQQVKGTYDLVMDFGAINDLSQTDRDLYIKNVLPLINPNGHYAMFCFEKMFPSKEVYRRFQETLAIQILEEKSDFPGTIILYLMTRQKSK